MATQPRNITRGAVWAVCRRTNLRKYFWTPRQWAGTHVRDIWWYALGLCLLRYPGIHLFSSSLMATHHHTEVGDRFGDLPDFVRDLHRESSKALSAFMEAEGYEAPGGVWDARKCHLMRLEGAATQLGHIVYSRNNSVTAGLVADAREWPMITPLDGSPRVKKPPFYFGELAPSEVVVASELPSELRVAFGGRERARREIETLQRAQRVAGTPRGLAAVSRLEPWDEPHTAREVAAAATPTFAFHGHGPEADLARTERSLEVVRFRRERRVVVVLKQAGATQLVWPHGTWNPVRSDGAAMAPAHPDAIMFRPKEWERGGVPAAASMRGVRGAAAAMLAEVEKEIDVGEAEAPCAEGDDAPASDVRVSRVERPGARRLVVLRARRVTPSSKSADPEGDT